MTNAQLADLLEEAARRLRGSESPMGDPLQLYTTIEAARLLRVSRNEVPRFIKPVRLSERRTRYRATDIAAYIASRANKNPAKAISGAGRG